MNATLSVAIRLPLADFELDVEFASSARCLGIFGASGSGKTSLLESIAGWRKEARGRIEVAGRVLLDRGPHGPGTSVPVHRRGIGYVPQDALLFPHWSVERNLRAHAAADDASPASFERAVLTLGIRSLLARDVTTLSGGERQRVAFARALLARPALFLFDEPLGGVDVGLRRRILPWLVRLKAATSAPMIFVSHDPTEVQVLCDEVVALERGRVRAHGPAAATLRALLAREDRFENVLEGTVVELGASTARVDVSGAEIHVARDGLESGARVAFSLGSDDVLLALAPPQGLSARNALPATVEGVVPGSAGTRVDLALAATARVLLSATVSAEAVEQLRIAPGRALYAVFKSSSCQVLSPKAHESSPA
ncbi:MAG TPA: molybdenum ABC transporter ATP-binding protein [Planctomycetota bacterium]|nr:molybdenum ABC transporter ATP-binding protein [Planctomycetota bacterium]